jgi:hypothetical protein
MKAFTVHDVFKIARFTDHLQRHVENSESFQKTPFSCGFFCVISGLLLPKLKRKNINFILSDDSIIQIKKFNLHSIAIALQYLVLIRGKKNSFSKNKSHYFVHFMIYCKSVTHNINIIVHFRNNVNSYVSAESLTTSWGHDIKYFKS